MAGYEKFLDALQLVAEITRVEAKQVYETYRKAKVLDVDKHGGHVGVKYGAFMEKDVILRALQPEVPTAKEKAAKDSTCKDNAMGF